MILYPDFYCKNIKDVDIEKLKENNIKGIILDVDNTLIDWKAEYWDCLKNVFDELNLQYSSEIKAKIQHAVDNYEDGTNFTYTKESMMKAIEEELGYKLPESFFGIWIRYLGMCVPEKADDEVVYTLQYLKQKYDLVVLSNWFKKSQDERLKRLGLDKYFSTTYMTENIPMKPNKEAFEIAKGPYEFSECVMVGDSLKTDVSGAVNANMNVIFYDRNNIKINSNEHIMATIRKFTELTDIL